MKLGVLYEEIGDFDKSLESYKRIEKDFSNSAEGRQVAKYIARVEMQLNK